MNRRMFFVAPGLTALAAMANAPLKLRLAGTMHLNLSPLHVAIEKGFFRDQGLEIEIVPLARSNDAIPVLAQGGLDVALYALNPPVINAIAKGVRIRLVAARDRVQPDCGDTGSLYSHSSIRSVAELKGRKVANGHAAGIVEFALDAALARTGLRPADVEVVRLLPADAAAALLRREVDALTGPDLSNMKVLRRPDFRLLTTLGRTLPGFQFAYVMFGRQLLDGPVDPGARFLRALLRGLGAYAGGATPAYMTDLAQKIGLDVAEVRTACRSHVVADGRIDRASIDRFAAWAHGKGYCEKLPSANALVEERFLQAAARP